MKRIVWRLKELPTTEKLIQLVKDNVLTKEEVREILFNVSEENERTIESYQQEIKFLREIIEKLSSRERIVEIIKEYRYPYRWYEPYYTWSGGTSTILGQATGSTILTCTSTSSGDNFTTVSTF